MKKTEILTFIYSHDLCVLSTVNPKNTPEAAVIKFAITNNFEIIFNTYNTYRKYKNMHSNQNVAVVIGGEKGITVQYEGKAQELSGKELEQYIALFHQKHTKSKWHTHPETRFFKIKPIWLRYSDVRDFEKKEIVEIDDF
ncbi:MAG TPA: pyridoxamine 5'-phosphate oxidase family protein [Candidatus Nanoarchaeia archaeon]|nr:pyridoxamine 5'-phosphate oxidase family protein [Candidatus Nanoarchaeia archaeon]